MVRTRSVRGRVGVAKGVGPEGGNPLPRGQGDEQSLEFFGQIDVESPL